MRTTGTLAPACATWPLILCALPMLLLAASACGGTGPGTDDRDESGTTSSAMKYSFWWNDPASEPIFSNPFGGPAGTGVANLPGATGSPSACRECSFTVSDATSSDSHVDGATSPEAYKSKFWTYGNSDSLQSVLAAAIPEARSTLAASYASNLDQTMNDYRKLLLAWPGISDSDVPEPTTSVTEWFRGYQPTQTRERVTEQKGKVLNNPNPFVFEELRHRGARAYCAMREAARQQDNTGKYSQGSSSDVDFVEWTLGSSRSKVAVGPVWKDVTSHVANSFVIPIAIGSKIAPITGPLMPSQAEVVHPVAWISGDSILASLEKGDVYLNTQHADGFLGQRVTGHLEADDLPIFSYGIINVKASITYDAEFGTPLATSQPTPSFDSELKTGRGLDIVADFAGQTAEAFAPPLRTYKLDKQVGGHYQPSAVASDAPIAFHASIPLFFAPHEDVLMSDPYKVDFLSYLGDLARYIGDDDRAITIGDRVSQKLTLEYGGGFNYSAGVFSISIGIAGDSTLDLTASRLTTIRDQVSTVEADRLIPAQNSTGLVPQSNVLVVPESKTTYTIDPLTIKAIFDLHADVFGFHVDEHLEYKIYSAPSVDLGGQDQTIGSESSRLRVGTFTDYGYEYGQPIKARKTYSHLPDPAISDEASVPAFGSYNGTLKTVPACIDDTKDPPGHVPPPTPGTPGTQPKLRECVYGPACVSYGKESCASDWGIPANICAPGQIAAYVQQLPTDFRSCLTDALAFLCDPSESPAPKVQQLSSLETVIARASDPETAAEIQHQCLMDAKPSNQQEADADAAVVANLFHIGLCDQSWNIQGDPTKSP